VVEIKVDLRPTRSLPLRVKDEVTRIRKQSSRAGFVLKTLLAVLALTSGLTIFTNTEPVYPSFPTTETSSLSDLGLLLHSAVDHEVAEALGQAQRARPPEEEVLWRAGHTHVQVLPDPEATQRTGLVMDSEWQKVTEVDWKKKLATIRCVAWNYTDQDVEVHESDLVGIGKRLTPSTVLQQKQLNLTRAAAEGADLPIPSYQAGKAVTRMWLEAHNQKTGTEAQKPVARNTREAENSGGDTRDIGKPLSDESKHSIQDTLPTPPQPSIGSGVNGDKQSGAYPYDPGGGSEEGGAGQASYDEDGVLSPQPRKWDREVEFNEGLLDEKMVLSREYVIQQTKTYKNLSETQRQQIEELVLEYIEIFTKKAVICGTAKYPAGRIGTGPNLKLKARVRVFNPQEMQVIEYKVKQLLEAGVVEPCYGPFASPIVLAPKAGSKPKEEGVEESIEELSSRYRLCINYSALNKSIIESAKTDLHPLPNIQQIYELLGGFRYFSAVDAASGFHQLWVHPDDRDKLGFICHLGLFRYTCLPFGVTTAPAIFQRVVNDMVGMNNLYHNFFAYVDDILCGTAEWEDHVQKLRELFQRFKDSGLRMRLDKCQFGYPEVKFLGFLCGVNGVRTDPKKVEAVVRWPAPRNNLTEVQSFLGKIKYYAKFIPDCAGRSKHLTSLTRKGVNIPEEWEKSDVYNREFEDLKNALVTAPVLRHPDRSKDFILGVDTSPFSTGAVLSQKFDDGEHPICFWSRTLSTSERNYHQAEREALGMVTALEHFRHFLEYKNFQVEVDNAAVSFLLNGKTSGRLNRWKIRMLPYEGRFELRHKPGTQHANADAMSRIKWSNIEQDISDYEHVYGPLADCVDTPPGVMDLLLEFLPKDQVVYDPFFHTGAGETYLKSKGYKVRPAKGVNFFDRNERDKDKYDVIVTNGPFSRLPDIIEEFNRMNSPFALLAPIRSLTKRYMSLNLEDPAVQLIIIQSDVVFGDKGKVAPFRVVWICRGLNLPASLIRRKVDTPRKRAEEETVLTASSDGDTNATGVQESAARVRKCVAREVAFDALGGSLERDGLVVDSHESWEPRVFPAPTTLPVRSLKDRSTICLLPGCGKEVEPGACPRTGQPKLACSPAHLLQAEEVEHKLERKRDPGDPASHAEGAKGDESKSNRKGSSAYTVQEEKMLARETLPSLVVLGELQRKDPELGDLILYLTKDILPPDENARKRIKRKAEYYEWKRGRLLYKKTQYVVPTRNVQDQAAEARKEDGLFEKMELTDREKKEYQDLKNESRKSYVEVIPKILQGRVKHLYHEKCCHVAAPKALRNMKQDIWWKGMDRDMRRWTKRCEACQRFKGKSGGKNPGPMTIRDKPRPFEEVSIDFYGSFPKTRLADRTVMTFYDIGSKWTEAYPSQNQTAETTAKNLLKFIYRHGCPRVIISDRGTNFTSAVLDELTTLVGIDMHYISARHPQANPVERIHKWITAGLAIASHKSKFYNRWDEALEEIMFAHRTSYLIEEGYTPFELAYAREPVTPRMLAIEALCGEQRPNTLPLAVDERIEWLTECHLNLIPGYLQRKYAAKARYDLTRKRAEFGPGDLVYVRRPPPGYKLAVGHKLKPAYQGPVEVLWRSADGGQLVVEGLRGPIHVAVKDVKPHLKKGESNPDKLERAVAEADFPAMSRSKLVKWIKHYPEQGGDLVAAFQVNAADLEGEGSKESRDLAVEEKKVNEPFQSEETFDVKAEDAATTPGADERVPDPREGKLVILATKEAPGWMVAKLEARTAADKVIVHWYGTPNNNFVATPGSTFFPCWRHSVQMKLAYTAGPPSSYYEEERDEVGAGTIQEEIPAFELTKGDRKRGGRKLPKETKAQLEQWILQQEGEQSEEEKRDVAPEALPAPPSVRRTVLFERLLATRVPENGYSNTLVALLVLKLVSQLSQVPVLGFSLGLIANATILVVLLSPLFPKVEGKSPPRGFPTLEPWSVRRIKVLGRRNPVASNPIVNPTQLSKEARERQAKATLLEFYNLPFISNELADSWVLYYFKEANKRVEVRLGRFVKIYLSADGTTRYVIQEWYKKNGAFELDGHFSRVLTRKDLLWIGNQLGSLVNTAAEQRMVIRHRSQEWLARKRDFSLEGWQWVKPNTQALLATQAWWNIQETH
jgi:hypothetical protein